jgi:excisionase family DNA binding protein
METECYLSIKDVARLMGVTKQAIYVALSKKKLKAQKIGRDYRIYPKDLKEYEQTKYRRQYADKREDEISIAKASEILNVTVQVLYYAAKIGKIKFRRSGRSWFLDIDSLISYQKQKIGYQDIKLIFDA